MQFKTHQFSVLLQRTLSYPRKGGERIFHSPHTHTDTHTHTQTYAHKRAAVGKCHLSCNNKAESQDASASASFQCPCRFLHLADALTSVACLSVIYPYGFLGTQLINDKYCPEPSRQGRHATPIPPRSCHQVSIPHKSRLTTQLG